MTAFLAGQIRIIELIIRVFLISSASLELRLVIAEILRRPGIADHSS
jgi:hypothetical protein